MAKILIAEDSITDIEYIKSVLSNTGHTLSVAFDGEEAERMIKNEPFDLFILDVVMPKKNGFQICRDIKKNENLKNIPVIMLTAKTQMSDKLWAEKQGADEYLIKPCEPIDILLAVKKHLNQ
ncbi:MAG: two-component system response regulator [Nitrospira bacterium HGW-Nitrospira-1]|nr:MAG: two-component system response regulator [Nitrospira bacterium HGW-Nitrospira-1]